MRIGWPDGAAIAEDAAKARSATAAGRRRKILMAGPPSRFLACERVTAARRVVASQRTLRSDGDGQLAVHDEVIGNRRAPEIERILRRMILRFPFDVGGGGGDVRRILRETPPPGP